MLRRAFCWIPRQVRCWMPQRGVHWMLRRIVIISRSFAHEYRIGALLVRKKLGYAKKVS